MITSKGEAATLRSKGARGTMTSWPARATIRLTSVAPM